jgi:hypothetical protein
MEIKLTINGVDMVITTESVDEATQFISRLGSMANNDSQHSTANAVMENRHTSERSEPVDQADRSSMAASHSPDWESIQRLLNVMEGSAAAVAVHKLAEDPRGMSDAGWREAIGCQTLAPYLSWISRACQRANVEMQLLLTKRKRRYPDGQIAFHYRLSPGIAAAVMARPDFARRPSEAEIEHDDE